MNLTVQLVTTRACARSAPNRPAGYAVVSRFLIGYSQIKQGGDAMPTISMFFGILVSIFYGDNEQHHAPHIHVR